MSNNKRKPIFFTSDWHCGHTKVIEFDERPFKDLEDMHKSLIKTFNACAPTNGITYFLGDMGFTGTADLKKVIDQLNGTKILILGNHDKKMNAMYNAGFDAVMYSSHLYIANERVTMSHCPLRGLFREKVDKRYAGENWHGEKEHLAYSLEGQGQFHLHGHIHSEKKDRKLGRQYDVGVRANNYKPISLSQIESWIVRTKKKEEKLLTPGVILKRPILNNEGTAFEGYLKVKLITELTKKNWGDYPDHVYSWGAPTYPNRSFLLEVLENTCPGLQNSRWQPGYVTDLEISMNEAQYVVKE